MPEYGIFGLSSAESRSPASGRNGAASFRKPPTPPEAAAAPPPVSVIPGSNALTGPVTVGIAVALGTLAVLASGIGPGALDKSTGPAAPASPPAPNVPLVSESVLGTPTFAPAAPVPT